MRAGRLRHSITIQTAAETTDANGAIIASWGTYKALRASIEPLAGRELFTARQTFADATHNVVTRYYTGITTKMRVLFGSRTFDILAVLNTGERNRGLIYTCRENV